MARSSSFTLFFLLFYLTAQAETIRIAGEYFPPMTNYDKTGQQFEMAKEIFESRGYTVEIKVFPYRRALRNVESGAFDMMVGMIKNDSHKLVYSKYSHDADNVLILYPKRKEIKWRGLAETVSKKRVLMIPDLGFENFLNGITVRIIQHRSRTQIFRKILLGRADFMIDGESGYLLKETNPYRDHFETRKIGFLKVHAAFTNNSRGIQLKKIWDEEFPKFLDSGKLKPYYEKYGILREYKIMKNCLDEERN